MTNEELCTKIKNSERQYIPELFEQVHKLIIFLIRRYMPTDGSNIIELDDLLDAGFIAMLAAVEAYDVNSNLLFTTYLSFHVSNACKEVRGWQKRHPDPLINADSLNEPLTDEGDFTRADTIPDIKAGYAYDDLINDIALKQQMAPVISFVKTLPDIQYKIILLRCIRGYTIKQTAQVLGIEQAAVQSLLNKALRAVRTSKAVRAIQRELVLDINTPWYMNKGVMAFQSSGTSSVEDIFDFRERFIMQK